MRTFLSLALLLAFQGLFGLNVELSVKECAGVGAQGYPVRTVVPVQTGLYQNVNSFRLTDAGGATVPAQFDVLSRRYVGDKSITSVAVTYLPTVTAFNGAGTGMSKYYLKDDGAGNSTGTGLVVTDAADVITVVTGNSLKFTVKKSGFNILDQVWFDPNNSGDFSSGKLIVKSNAKGGGEFIGRLDTQYDADRTDLKVELEQSGPIEAVIRVEAVTKYYAPSNHTHGWAVRIYAYAGKPFIKIDYQLQNSAKTKLLGWPLYFHALNLNLDLNLGSTVSVKSGLGNGTVYSGARGNGVLLAQKKDSLFKVYSLNASGDTSAVLSTGGRPDGFLDIEDGTVGVTAVTRNFWRMWPNGLKADGSNKLTVQLFPEWAANVNAPSANPVFNATHLYWLQDMQHVFKEVVLNFHAAGQTDAQLIGFAKTVDHHPVATLPVSYLAVSGAGLDIEGMIPATSKISTQDVRLPKALSSGALGWDYYRLNGRRTNTATAGGWPQGGGQFWATENPSDWYESERDLIGELNIRPEWMAQYNFNDNYAALRLGMNACGGTIPPSFQPTSWRVQNCGGDQSDSAALFGTDVDFCSTIDNSHFWNYHISDAYWITGNLWLKDWYKFMGEFRKNFISEKIMEANDRANAHPWAEAMHAYKVSGDTSIIRMMSAMVQDKLRPTLREQYGDRSALSYGQRGASGWQTGFWTRSILDLMHEVREPNPQSWAECFQVMAGWMDWNLHWGNFGNYSWAPEIGASYIGAFTLMDAQAWYYWHTGRAEYRDHLDLYIDHGINGGSQPVNDVGAKSEWNGDYSGRWTRLVRTTKKADSLPPVAVSDLGLKRSGTQCTLTWTGPADAKRYHVVWSNTPLVQHSTEDLRYRNWWSANVIGPGFKPTPGGKEQLVFTGPDTGLVFAAVFSWDSAWNMSDMSNLGGSDTTPPTAPAGFTATVVNAQGINLAWQASGDLESGIYSYKVSRNGIVVAVLNNDAVGFQDRNLAEDTPYSYEVMAISGSLLESARSSASVRTPVDNASPVVVAARSISDKPEITVIFDEAVEKTSAETEAGYSLNLGRIIVSALLQPDNKTVILTCDSLKPATTYQLAVHSVKDKAITPNTVDTTVSFTSRTPFAITNSNQAGWVWDVLDVGKRYYCDESYAMSSVPDGYIGLPYWRPSNANKVIETRGDSIYTFDINKEAMVYVAYDDLQYNSNHKPSWLVNNFTDNGSNIDGFSLWEKKFQAGKVKLGGCAGNVLYSMYFVIVRPLDSSIVVGTESSEEAEFKDGIATSPNPFNPQVAITVQSGKWIDPGIHSSVRIYNLQGRLVTILTPSRVRLAGHSGRYEYVWNAASYASGTYLISADMQGKHWKKAVVLLK